MKKPFYKILYIQVLFAIFVGVLFGLYAPADAVDMKWLGDGFIKLIKMIIAPVIFCTVVHGVAGMESLAKLRRVGLKAIVYFEVVSTFALAIGLIVANTLRPGDGFTGGNMDAKAVASFVEQKPQTAVEMVLNIIPTTLVDAFAKGEILQVLLVSILFGLSLSFLGEKGKPIVHFVDDLSKAIFGVVNIIMKAAPIGAFGAMAFTIGKYGYHALIPLAKLIGSFYLTSLLFVLIVLGIIARLTGFSILRYLRYIKDELLIVLGTSSSESGLPSLMNKLEKLGCSKAVVGLVMPTGYSFNLDGTNIYMTMAALFIAQATNTNLTLGQQLTILGVAMLTSKGASGVTGAGFVTLAATLAVVPTIPVAGMALILGIDKFMSECRALTNFVGNGVAAIVVSSWEGELDRDVLRAELNGNPAAEAA
ncbi:MAG: dicarboxylate/amino acid:cation symporter [Burkholderiaceae bacterium]|nr:dicarboxylate/amino acid:cation symporter [Burkholderiaceae bacterium]